MAVVSPPPVVTLNESVRGAVVDPFTAVIIMDISNRITPTPIKPITLLCIAVTCLYYDLLKTKEASGGLFPQLASSALIAIIYLIIFC
jgi:hypothetical protein